MDQQCISIGHEGQKIEKICRNLGCKKKLLCFKCYFESHNGHDTIDLKDFNLLIQNLQNKNNCNIFEVVANRSKCIKQFKQDIDEIIDKLDNEFTNHKKYLDIQITNLKEHNLCKFSESFIALIFNLEQSNILQENFTKLEQLFLDQKIFLEQMVKDFRNYSSELIIQTFVQDKITNEQQVHFYYEKLNKFSDIPEEYQLLRGKSLLRKQQFCDNGIYYGEFNGQQKEGIGMLIDNESQVIYDGVWKNNTIQWGRKIFSENGVLKIIVGQLDSSLNNFGLCIMEDSDGNNFIGDMESGKYKGNGEFTFANNDKYSGQFENNLFQGIGELIYYEAQQYYRGQFEQGRKHGQGEQKLNNKNKYVGIFANDQITGQGIIYDSCGEKVAEGQFVNGLLNGKGIKYNLEATYEGDFIEEKKHGFGIYKQKSGNIYTGYFSNDKYDGIGYLQLVNQNFKFKGIFKSSEFIQGYFECSKYIYIGGFQNKKMNGKGIYYSLLDNSSYIGHFKNDKKIGKGKIQFANNDSFIGEFINNLPNGIGTTKYHDGREHTGLYVNGQLEGQGTMKYPNGDLYEGMFSNNFKSKNGRLVLQTGEIFEGEFENDNFKQGGFIFSNGNKFNGNFLNNQISKGKMIYANGNEYFGMFSKEMYEGYGELIEKLDTDIIKYQGQFHENQKHGKGNEQRYTLINGQENQVSEYSGYFQFGKKQDENGKMKIYNSLQYEGQFTEGEMSGKGQIIYASGFEHKYQGTVLKGQKQGVGKLYFQNYNGYFLETIIQRWNYYEGDFDQDKITGSGQLVYMNNDIYVGQFVNGEKEGQGCFTKSTGLKYIGQFQGDKKSGQGTESQNNKEIYKGSWQEDIYEGEGRLAFPNGESYYEGYFVAGQCSGKGIEYYQKGIKKFEGEFKNGKRHGKGIQYFPNGQIQYEGDYQGSIMKGQGKLNYLNDKRFISYEGTFDNDKKDGEGREIYISGQEYKGGFSNDKRSGKGTYYFKDGRIYEGQFKDDLRNDEKGKLIYPNGEIEIGQYENDMEVGTHQVYESGHTEPSKQRQYKAGSLMSENSCIVQ